MQGRSLFYACVFNLLSRILSPPYQYAKFLRLLCEQQKRGVRAGGRRSQNFLFGLEPKLIAWAVWVVCTENC